MGYGNIDNPNVLEGLGAVSKAQEAICRQYRDAQMSRCRDIWDSGDHTGGRICRNKVNDEYDECADRRGGLTNKGGRMWGNESVSSSNYRGNFALQPLRPVNSQPSLVDTRNMRIGLSGVFDGITLDSIAKMSPQEAQVLAQSLATASATFTGDDLVKWKALQSRVQSNPSSSAKGDSIIDTISEYATNPYAIAGAVGVVGLTAYLLTKKKGRR